MPLEYVSYGPDKKRSHQNAPVYPLYRKNGVYNPPRTGISEAVSADLLFPRQILSGYPDVLSLPQKQEQGHP